MENAIRIKHTIFPNGDILKYKDGKPHHVLLPSNHPNVLKLQLTQVKNIQKESYGK